MELRRLECVWVDRPDGGVVCSRCGLPCESRRLRRRCRLPGEPREEPGLITKVKHYAISVARWNAAGSPVRPTEEIGRIFSICESCEHYAKASRPHCKLCGCSLSKLPNGLLNKIAMATESCPLDPPRWNADV